MAIIKHDARKRLGVLTHKGMKAEMLFWTMGRPSPIDFCQVFVQSPSSPATSAHATTSPLISP